MIRFESEKGLESKYLHDDPTPSFIDRTGGHIMSASDYVPSMTFYEIKDVIAVRKGPHWKNLPYGTNIGKPCDNPMYNQREIGDIEYKSIS